MRSKPAIVETEDGSITCFDDETGELYHNRAGAYAEALKNFVEPSGLIDLCREQKEVSFLDLPFGLAYNTFLFLQMLLALQSDAVAEEIRVIGIELDPYIMSLLDRILLDQKFSALAQAIPDCREFLNKLARFESVDFQLNETRIFLHCRQGDIRHVVPELLEQGWKFDAILHDPFSPNKMPELWTMDLFSNYAKLLKPKGRIITYSAAVAVRSALQKNGFYVYRTTALGGKSGGTLAARASFNAGAMPFGVFELTPEELARLTTKSAVPYRDPQFCTTRQQILKRRAAEQRDQH